MPIFRVTDGHAAVSFYKRLGFGVEVEAVPWGRQIEVTDPDGNRLRIGTVPVR